LLSRFAAVEGGETKVCSLAPAHMHENAAELRKSQEFIVGEKPDGTVEINDVGFHGDLAVCTDDAPQTPVKLLYRPSGTRQRS
jgi:hypothetical protein